MRRVQTGGLINPTSRSSVATGGEIRGKEDGYGRPDEREAVGRKMDESINIRIFFLYLFTLSTNFIMAGKGASRVD